MHAPYIPRKPGFDVVKRIPILLVAAAIGVALSSPPAQAQQGRGLEEQGNAYRANREGHILSLPEVRSRIRVPNAQYIGAEMPSPLVYRLKYMRGGAVIWIDVDARTGRIVARTGG